MKKALIVFVASIVRKLRGEVSTRALKKRGLVVGDGFSREGGVRIDSSYCFLIEIGDNVILAPNVNILAHDASLKNTLGVSKVGRVSIGNNVFIGASSIVLPNVNIGDNVIVGAGSVVNKSIPNNTVAAGNPIKSICSISEFKNKNIDLLKSRPTYDRTYEAFNISKEQRDKMKKDLIDGYGFFQCDNYQEMFDNRIKL